MMPYTSTKVDTIVKPLEGTFVKKKEEPTRGTISRVRK